MTKMVAKESLAVLGSIAAIVSICIAAIALIPAFGQWLYPRTPSEPTPHIQELSATPVVQVTKMTSVTQETPEPTFTTVLAPTSIPLPTTQQSTTSPLTSNTVKSRAEMLVIYDSIYRQQGWCSVWSKLIEDGLVKRNCPSNVLQWAYEDVDTPNGQTNLFTGLQVRDAEDIEVYYPACVTFGVANYTGGTVEPWIHNDYIATNITMHADSVHSLFFRCDNAWSP